MSTFQVAEIDDTVQFSGQELEQDNVNGLTCQDDNLA